MIFPIDHPDVRRAVDAALAEDLGPGDFTTSTTIPADLQAEARFVAKQDIVVAGSELLTLLFDSPHIQKNSGDRARAGETIATVRASARTLLSRERVSLNFLQRLSGVATLAAKFVEAIEG